MLNKIILIAIFIMTSKSAFSQISTYEFVKIKNEKTNEAIFFYENNWKIFREKALKEKFIVAYELVLNEDKNNSSFDIILITTYKDSIAYTKSEQRFQNIIKELRPNGAILLNELKPIDFRENVGVEKFTTKFISNKKHKLK